MSTRPQAGKKRITVKQVALVAAVPGISGGLYGFITGGPLSMMIQFAEFFIAGFVVVYVCASFVVLLRK